MTEKSEWQNDIERRKAAVDVYSETCSRLEPAIAMIDAGAFYASASISLKRIADALNTKPAKIIKVVDARGLKFAATLIGEENGDVFYQLKREIMSP